MGLTFQQPWWLLLLLLAIPAAWTALRWFSSMSRARRWSAAVLRIALIALVAGLLAGSSAVRQTDKLATVVLLDVSGSVSRFAEGGVDDQGQPIDYVERVRRYLRQATDGRGADDLLGVVVFDRRPVAIATPTRGDVLDRSFEIERVEGTSIADAIRFGAAMIPSDAAGRLLLVSDGNETIGDALEAASRLAAGSEVGGRVPIDVLPIRYRVERETILESVDAPPRAPGESLVTVRVNLRSTAGSEGTLRLFREGEPVDLSPGEPGTGRRITLQPGVNVELIDVRLGSGRIHRFEAVYEPDRIERADGRVEFSGDTYLANNRGEAFTLTPGDGSVLLVDSDGVSGHLQRVLEDANIEVSVTAPEGIPDNLLSLQAYDLIVLVNIPANEIPTERQRQLVAHVRDLGGGLIKIGGYDAFGAGAWRNSELEPILPVRLDLPDRLVQAEAAVVFVIDRSGSMAARVGGSSRTQQQVANEASAMAVRTLDEQDLVGIIAHDSRAEEIVPLGPNTDPERTASLILGIAPGGGTTIGPAVEKAWDSLNEVDAKTKHVIVLSDGVATDRARLPGLVRDMSRDGIKLTSIAIGDIADVETLEAMAAEGGGAFYNVVNPAILPQIFINAVRVIRQPMIREQTFSPLLVDVSPLTMGLSNVPDLHGLTLAQHRDDPTVTVAMETPDGQPLLAHWSVELGQVAAFTSDVHENWAADWLGWEGYARLWTQAARSISRGSMPRGYDLSTTIVGDELRIRLDASDDDGRPMDMLTVPATVYTPSGETRQITLTQTGPGRYEGRLPTDESGSYVTVLRPQRGEQRLQPVIGGASMASGMEFRRLSSNTPLLERIAEITGGRVLDAASPPLAADLYDRTDIEPRRAMSPIWRSLLLWTVIVLLLDIATRRVAWDRYFSKEYGVNLRRLATESVKGRGEQSAGTLSGLKSRRETVRQRSSGRAGGEQQPASKPVEPSDTRPGAPTPAASPTPTKPAAPRPEPSKKPPKDQGPKDQGDDGDDDGGLMAAKRRARKRYGGS